MNLFTGSIASQSGEPGTAHNRLGLELFDGDFHAGRLHAGASAASRRWLAEYVNRTRATTAYIFHHGRLHNICSMNFRMMRGCAWILCAAPLGWQLVAAARRAPVGAAQTARDPEFFETKIRPVLAANCYDCHTEMRNGGLRLDSREAMLKGGRTGPAIVPGDPDKSLLIQAVRQTSES